MFTKIKGLHLGLLCTDYSIRNASAIKAHRAAALSDSFSLVVALKSCAHNLPLIRHLHAHLLKLGFSSHLYVSTSLLSVYASALFTDACILFDEMPARSTVSWNIMITGYSRRGDTKAARHLFDTMPLPNLASWSAMVAAYIQNSLWNHGLALFRQMISASDGGLKPDQLTLGPVIAGCSRLGSVGLPLGQSMHAFIVKNNWELNVELGTCLVDMYAKCGLFKNACLIFDRIKDRNVAAWTALICGAAQHGHGQEALQVFEKMMAAGVKPNELTFTGVLTACVQAGLVNEGRRYFGMIGECGLKPKIQHYGCMVDLFGKAGFLDEAYRVISTMPYEATVVVWSSFLSSCKLYKQFEMADKVIGKVMSTIQPENGGGVYSIISDLYMLSGRISEAEKLRELMLGQNVRKVRASSFITV